ncbi:MAG TPA: sulfotransferase [Rhodanobacter sp.]|jgi:tetratricopeptide (TPR) repeat protein|nr:sulfotransferase [Rhodanobacter sp.]
MPNDPNEQIDSAFAAAKTAWERNDPATAEAMLRAINARVPAREDVARLLCNVLRNRGRLSAAAQLALELCEASNFDPGVSLWSAEFARQCDRHRVAARICDDALAHGPASANLLLLAAHVARESGDFDLAHRRYLQALDAGIDLERQHVFGALANTRRFTDPGDPDIRGFERHFHDSAYSNRSRASAGFGLAKAWNDLGDYATAARILRDANAMMRSVQSWDAASWRSFVTTRMAECAVPPTRSASGGFVPVFITGVPRSGTTLTATLLARTSGVRDRGEFRALRFIADQLISGGHLGNPAALAEATNLYRTLAVQDDAPAAWYIDQDPLNFRYLDIAAAMFPQARVIHVRRDRRDTALSLWSQDFAHPDLAFAYDFEDMAGYMAGHDALMKHWKESLRVPIHELDYENLVTDTEATLASLCDFIGAPACGRSTSDESAPVQSASVWQARQPVYSTSVGRWRHYAPYVPELVQFGERN